MVKLVLGLPRLNTRERREITELRQIDKVLQYLGEPYSITQINGEDVIYRDLGNGYDFEVSGVHNGSKHFSLYVWQIEPHKEIMGIYHNIRDAEQLKDVLGYCAFRYQNLQRKIQVEREELPQ